MNNEKILEKLHGIAALLPDDERKNFDYYRKSPEIIKTVEKYADSLSIRIASLIADVENDLRLETAKKCGKLDRLKAAQRIIKEAKTTPHTALHGAWIADGVQMFCDGARLVCLSEHLDLEKIPENVQPINAARIVNGAKDNQGEKLVLPDIATLKTFIKTEKAIKKATKDRAPVLYDFGDGMPAVNAQYLLDILEIFPDATATASKQRPTLSAIYFKSADGEGVLLPVKKAVNA